MTDRVVRLVTAPVDGQGVPLGDAELREVSDLLMEWLARGAGGRASVLVGGDAAVGTVTVQLVLPAVARSALREPGDVNP